VPCDLVADALDEHHGHSVRPFATACAVARIEAAGPVRLKNVGLLRLLGSA
jgi:hypothetical protein